MSSPAPRRPGPPRRKEQASGPVDLLLEGLARLVTEGPAAAAPALRQAVSAFAGGDLPMSDRLQFGPMAHGAAIALWVEEGQRDLDPADPAGPYRRCARPAADRPGRAGHRCAARSVCPVGYFLLEGGTARRTPKPASVEARTVLSGSGRGSADMARRSPSDRRPLGSAHVMRRVVPQRSTQLRRRAHALHPRGGAARPGIPASCNSLIPHRSCPARPAP
jgi:hypothetical protein